MPRHLRYGGGLVHAQPPGDAHHVSAVDRHVLSVAAAREQRHDGLAPGHAGHESPHLRHVAGALQPQHLAHTRGHRVQAAPLESVSSVDRHRVHLTSLQHSSFSVKFDEDLDEDIVVSKSWFVDLAQIQHIRVTWLVLQHGQHDFISLQQN